MCLYMLHELGPAIGLQSCAGMSRHATFALGVGVSSFILAPFVQLYAWDPLPCVLLSSTSYTKLSGAVVRS